MNLKLSDIRTDGGTQCRVQLDAIAIGEYAKAMQEGAQFPPIVVFHDGTDYWLADGFHRVEAAGYAELSEIVAEVRQGTLRDAIWFALGANKTHGVRINEADNKHILTKVFGDEKWRAISLREISRHTGVPETTVRRWYDRLSAPLAQIWKPTNRVAHRNGTTYTMNTANIGKPQPVRRASFDDGWDNHPDEPARAQDEDEQYLDELAGDTRNYNWTVEAPIVPEPVSQAIASTVTIHNTDAQNIHLLNIPPVHLVVTSPPYNVGIDYDVYTDDLLTYLPMLTAVWRQCSNTMADGARIAVVVPFGVGRNPWTPLACKVMQTLNDAGFILRGQIIWDKNTSGNRTSWGSFRLPSDPSLRDTTEAIIVAHKGNSKLDIPEAIKLRDDKGTCTPWLMDSDYFMELAQDHWVVAPESAQRIKHPAPFPVELVKRLIHFYAYLGAHILDPFAGSGTTGVASLQCGCNATLVEIDGGYCKLAEERCR